MCVRKFWFKALKALNFCSFFISEPSSCCYSISFLGYWHSHSRNFCFLWIQASHCNRQCLGLTEEHCLTLIRIHEVKENDFISSFFMGGKVKILEDFWEISTILNLPQNVSYQPRTTWISFWAAARTCLLCVWCKS